LLLKIDKHIGSVDLKAGFLLVSKDYVSTFDKGIEINLLFIWLPFLFLSVKCTHSTTLPNNIKIKQSIKILKLIASNSDVIFALDRWAMWWYGDVGSCFRNTHTTHHGLGYFIHYTKICMCLEYDARHIHVASAVISAEKAVRYSSTRHMSNWHGCCQ
jgi:hypothetical protein